MPVYDLTNSDWTDGATKLAEVLMPDPSQLAMRKSRAAQARKTGYEAELKAHELSTRQRMNDAMLAGIFTDPSIGAGAVSLGDPNILKANYMLRSALPGVTPEDAARMQTAGGIQTHAGTLQGFTAHEQGLTDRNAADNARAIEVERMQQAGLDRRFRHNVGENQTTIGLDNQPVAYGSGVALGPDGRPAAPEDNTNANPYLLEGTGLDQQMWNSFTRLRNKLESGVDLTADDANAARMLYHHFTKPEWREVKGSDGSVSMRQIAGRLPPGAEFLRDMVADPAAERSIPFDQRVDTAGTIAPGAEGVQGSALADTLTGAGMSGQTVGAPGDIILKGPDRFTPRTEGQAKFYNFVRRVENAVPDFFDLLGLDPTTGTLTEGYRPDMISYMVGEWMSPAWRGYFLSEDAQRYHTGVQQILNPLIRADSGAAVPYTEYPRYYTQFIPLPGESERVVAMKLEHLLATMRAFQELAKIYPDADFENDDEAVKSLHPVFMDLKNKHWTGKRIKYRVKPPAADATDPDIDALLDQYAPNKG